MRTTKAELRQRRKRRIRARIIGGSSRPRLSIYCSLLRVYAQIVDDTSGKTLVAVASKSGEKNIAAAAKVGELIAKKAKDAKVSTVVFDRNGRKYHGRLKALADAARAGGLQF